MSIENKRGTKRRSIVRFRHRVVFAILRPIFRVYLKLAYGYSAAKYRHPKKEPVLVLANHNCNLDPFFVAMSFAHPLYFVASDQIFRLGFLSAAMNYLVAPIPIFKSKMDLETIRTMISTKNAGGSVCLFPEGNRSFNGVTGHIPSSTAKLIKMLNVPLVLYRITGAYLTTPRWATGIRKGKATGAVVETLSAERIAAMSVDEINEAIHGALYVDAFESQQVNPVRYRCQQGAEYLERVLFLCPHCRSFATMKSEGDLFACSCGYRVRYNQFGLFEGVDDGLCIHLHVLAWDNWQREAIVEMAKSDDARMFSAQMPLFCDEEEELHLVSRGKSGTGLGTGTLRMYFDRIEFIQGDQTRVFPLSEISKMIIWSKQLLQFTTTDDQSYEFKSERPRSAYKYMALYHVLEQKRRGMDYGFFGI